MHEFILGIICVVAWGTVLGYIFFSKNKVEKKSIFFLPDVTWDGYDAEDVFENLENSEEKVTFKGEHRIN